MRKQKILIDVNLARRQAKGSAITKVFITALFFISIILTWYTLNIHMTNLSSIAKLEEYSNMLEKKQPAQARADVNVDKLKKDIEFINDIIIKKTFSWTALLTDLEASVPDNVHLMAISPDFNSGKVAVTGRAKAMKDVLSMVDTMGASKSFADVFLLSHSEEKDGGYVLFRISSVYKAEGL